ncbi:MAG: hypothetical protein NT004_16960 [Bacteroidetes bacterium]|nr:hypothetical protein [Bacteroidota bacterium]
MRNIFTILSFSFILFSALSCKKEEKSLVYPPPVVSKSDSIVMSAGYANEVYYSLATGIALTSPRATWDIAFRTTKRSSSIIINDGAGVALYTYPKSDTSGWATIDTTGLSSWKPMYNDPGNWENGAFSRYAKGYFDYGWCIYNDVTHNLVGDSLFVIKLRDGNFKKLWMIKKLSSLDIYLFRYANLDGSGEQYVSEDVSSLIATDFSGFSLQTNARVAFQPVRNTWDILFTKYMSVQSDGSPYLVTGALGADSVITKKFYPVALNYSNSEVGIWDSTRSSIGWNWKIFNMNTYTYKIVDSTVYFIKPVKGDIYKLYFTAFSGTSTGIVKFNIEK